MSEHGDAIRRALWTECGGVTRTRADEALGFLEASLDALVVERDETAARLEAALSEVDALRRQVAELTTLGVSLHKAEDRGRREERAAIVAYLQGIGWDTEGWSVYCAYCIECGKHEVTP